MRHPRKCLALTLVMLAAGPALAEPRISTRPELNLPVTVSLDVETQWHLDSGYRLFGTDRTPTHSGVSASLQAGRLAGGRLELGAGLHGNTSTAAFAGQNEAKLEERTPSLSALLRWSPYRWLEPHLRVAADVTRANLRLTVSNSATVLEDTVWSPGGSAGVGLRLRTGTLATALNGGGLGIAGAVIIEGGFHLGVPYSFSVSPPRPSDEKLANDRIPATSTPLGDLGRAQPYLRLSFALLI